MRLLPKTFGARGILFLGVTVSESMSLRQKKPCEHRISKTNEGNFTQFWSQLYIGS